MRVPIDDGAMPDVVLLDDETAVQAVDVRDGEVLWRRERVDGVLLRLGGVVMVEDKERLRVLDLSTGRERWSVRRGLGAATPGTRPVTDGVRVLVPGYDIDAGRRVTAYDLREGTRDWSVTLPPRVSALSVSGGVLVGTGDQMVVLGSAPEDEQGALVPSPRRGTSPTTGSLASASAASWRARFHSTPECAPTSTRASRQDRSGSSSSAMAGTASADSPAR